MSVQIRVYGSNCRYVVNWAWDGIAEKKCVLHHPRDGGDKRAWHLCEDVQAYKLDRGWRQLTRYPIEMMSGAAYDLHARMREIGYSLPFEVDPVRVWCRNFNVHDYSLYFRNKDNEVTITVRSTDDPDAHSLAAAAHEWHLSHRKKKYWYVSLTEVDPTPLYPLYDRLLELGHELPFELPLIDTK